MHNDNRDIPREVRPPNPKYLLWLKRTINVFMDVFPPPSKVLDVGTRYGHGVELLQARGYDVLGTELLPQYVQEARRCGRAVVEDDIIDTVVARETFDVVFSRHCIEHTRDPLVFFQNCYKVLKPGGGLFITFPIEGKKKWESRKTKGNHMFYFRDKEDVKVRAQMGGFLVLTLCHSRALSIPCGEDEYTLIGERCKS